MKNKYLLSAAIGLFLIAIVSGCGTFGGLFTATPQVHTVYRSERVLTPVTQPDGTTIVTTNTVMIPIQVTNLIYTVNPGVDQAINTGQTVSSFLPPPYGTAATAGLGLLSAVLGFIARAKSQKLDSVQAVADMVKPIIAGVEQGGDAATKQAIQSHAAAAGVQQHLDQMVQTLTSQMPAQPPTAK